MIKVRREDWDAIHPDYKGIFQDYHGDCPEWKGRNCVMSGCVSKELGKLLIEGVHFIIVDDEPMDGFYDASTEAKFNKVIAMLLARGYDWVGLSKRPTFNECKSQIHGNAKLVIHAFYNDITGRREILFGSRSIYNSYPQYSKGIKVIEV